MTIPRDKRRRIVVDRVEYYYCVSRDDEQIKIYVEEAEGNKNWNFIEKLEEMGNKTKEISPIHVKLHLQQALGLGEL